MTTLPRRAFLHSFIATAGLGVLGRPLFAKDKPRAGFGLGFTLYGMKSLPLDDAL